MENSISNIRQLFPCSKNSQNGLNPMIRKSQTNTQNFALRLAREGDWVKIVAVSGGRGFHDRLAGLGLRIGAKIQVLRNAMDGKLLLGHEETRFFIGGGMAHKIQVTVIEGDT